MRQKFGFTKLKNLLQSLCCINIVSLIFNVESDKKKKLRWHKKSPGPWIHHNVCLFSQPNQVMPTWWELLVSSRTLGNQVGFKHFVSRAHTPSPSSKPLLPLRAKRFYHIKSNMCLFWNWLWRCPHNSVNILKSTELYIFNEPIVWFVSYISTGPFKNI